MMVLPACHRKFYGKSVSQIGLASYYADSFEGRLTANGEIFSQKAMTAAHKTLPFGTRLKVLNLENNKTCIVRINDRGPFVKGRILDLSYQAASKLDMLKKGVVRVQLTILR